MNTMTRLNWSVNTATTGESRWASELRAMLRSLNYPPCNVTAALAWIEHRGKIDGCPIVDVEDWPSVNAIVRRADDQADAHETADSHRPRRFEPTPEDQAWWAAESAHMASIRDARYHGPRAATSRAPAKRGFGLIPLYIAEAIARTREGHND